MTINDKRKVLEAYELMRKVCNSASNCNNCKLLDPETNNCAKSILDDIIPELETEAHLYD